MCLLLQAPFLPENGVRIGEIMVPRPGKGHEGEVPGFDPETNATKPQLGTTGDIVPLSRESIMELQLNRRFVC